MVSVFSSDSDSDMEVLAQLSDWDSNSTDSDSKEEQLCCSSLRINRLNYMQSLEDAEFTLRFRLSKSGVTSLLMEIMPYVRVTSSRNHGVPPLHQLLLTLRFYALGTMLISIADFVGVSKSTAGRTAIASLYDKYVFVNLGGAEKFYEIAGFPQVLGAIDCTHICIQSLCHVLGEEFRNCDGFFYLNVQTVCDADLKFINVVAQWLGSTHDATIFDNSVLRGNILIVLMEQEANCLYAHLMESDCHCQWTSTKMRAFLTVGNKMPVLAVTLCLSLPVVQATVIATAVLYNICRNNNIKEVPPEINVPIYNVPNYHEFITQNVDTQDQTRANVVNKYFM
nr:protein ALP1-like [Vanessa tameamea]